MEHSARLGKENPAMSRNHLAKLIGEMWCQLPHEVKHVYNERGKLDKDRYDRDYMAEAIAKGGQLMYYKTYRQMAKLPKDAVDYEYPVELPRDQ